MTRINQQEKSDVRIKVNGQIQGSVKTGTECLSYILSLGMEDLKYFSKEGMIDWMTGALDMAEDVMGWGKDTPLKRRIDIYRKTLNKVTTREGAMNLFVNMQLSCEGLGTLSGFSMANVDSNEGRVKAKSKIHVNPEKKSYR
jgi:hypothetical protein